MLSFSSSIGFLWYSTCRSHSLAARLSAEGKSSSLASFFTRKESLFMLEATNLRLQTLLWIMGPSEVGV